MFPSTVVRVLVAMVSLTASVGGIAAELPSRSYYHLPEMCDTVVTVATLPVGSRYVVMEARGYLTDDRECRGSSPLSWGVAWGGKCRYEVTLRGRNSDYGNLSDEYNIDVTATYEDAGGRHVIGEASVAKGIGLAGGRNSLSVELRGDSVADVYVGKNTLTRVLSFAVDSCCTGDSISWSIMSRGCFHPVMVMDEVEAEPSRVLATEWSYDGILSYLTRRQGADPVEGIWKYFDRSNNPVKGMVGGSYTLATVRNAGGGYDIIYLDGARTARGQWHAGMIKGRLAPTIFKEHFDLVWYDAMMNPVSDDANASITREGVLLEVALPVYETIIRFSRVPLSAMR